jgi:hypothetical protein
MKKPIIITVIAIIVLGAGIYLASKDKDKFIDEPIVDSYTGKSSRELALLCDPQEHIVMHIHPMLKITVDGQAQEIPNNIGIEGVDGDTSHDQALDSSPCLHFLHTHDATGKLHVESPLETDYKLSDFFAVWQKSFSKEQILDFKADAEHRIRMTVNGQESTEFENLIMRDEQQIEIIYEKI